MSARQYPTLTIYVAEITVNDPDTGAPVELEVHKDPTSGGLFAVDASYLDQIRSVVPSPFNRGEYLELVEP